MHRHPYAETWIVLSGESVITANGVDIDAREGDIVVVEPKTPHKFHNVGSGRLKIMCIHDSPQFVQEWLEEDCSVPT